MFLLGAETCETNRKIFSYS